MRKNWWKWALGALAGLVVLSALFGSDDEDPDVAKSRAVPKVTLEIAPTPDVVKAKTVTVAGVVAPARAIVEVGAGDSGDVADVDADGAFSADVDLTELGQNEITAAAHLGSRRAAAVRIVVERRMSPAEAAAKRQRIRARRAAAARERERREAARAERLAKRQAAKDRAAEERAAREAAEAAPAPEPEQSSGCNPNYSGCVPIASDVDCEGGSGDGPAYTGVVTVIGSDPYGLDSDSDGTACE